jgi:hypothetical protein
MKSKCKAALKNIKEKAEKNIFTLSPSSDLYSLDVS